MAIPQTKQELLSAISNHYDKLRTDLVDIPLNLINIKELPGHTKGSAMSVHNLVAYLVGWGELVLKWNAQREKGETVIFPEAGFKWNQLGLLAQKFYEDFESLPFPTLLTHLDTTVVKLIKPYTERRGIKTTPLDA